jgi:2-oxoglutarate ferredoxin oxidoreductase subunit delta
LSSGKRFKVAINPKWCKKCGICAAFCPTSVYTFKTGAVPAVTAEDKCIGCQLCVQRCPDFAITVKSREEEKHES